jgi:hypothetical protein
MNRSYFFATLTWSVLSGAGEYSQPPSNASLFSGVAIANNL